MTNDTRDDEPEDVIRERISCGSGCQCQGEFSTCPVREELRAREKKPLPDVASAITVVDRG